ncbi:endonuclease/exonuclease/phosphatase family protein [Pseudomassariella vexata]|uniref:Endonuclease/exonuclease/phosphatase family protein n=1 Tax=Pseudomassariella vexata TaxID=1141098 RepID=A0A1Y2DFI8_9PEZI|nr:endonuclease/exonuclease/phosphatase family protein [Pseudomassariella vexata]ORY57864.1 endonuclease/exonuclease/phosphatase family protein [Pseudomassariella vexata]
MLLIGIVSSLLFSAQAAQVTMAQTTNGTLPLRMITFNIRYATTSPSKNEQLWSTRAPLVVSRLMETSASAPAGAETVIGLQEVLHKQLLDIESGVGPEWMHIGVGRDDGAQRGEYNPILYRPAVLSLLYNETRWLSPTPDVPSFGWGAGSRRMINIGVFEHVASGRRFIAANTHLDNASSQARTEGIKIVIATIQAVQETWGPLGVVLTGDFNSQPGEDAYSTAVNSKYLTELYTMADTGQRFGPYITYTGFLPDQEEEVGTRIDFIWLGPALEDRWLVESYNVLPNVVNDVYISDHRPVFGDLMLK